MKLYFSNVSTEFYISSWEVTFCLQFLVTFVPNDFISDAAKNVMPIDAINYFCEMEYQNELERARNATAAPSEETTKSDRLRNTVVLLPKIDGYASEISSMPCLYQFEFIA